MPTTTCSESYQSPLTVSMLKIDCNTGRTQDWPAQGFVTCLTRLSIILCYNWFRFVHKRLFKILFKCKSKKSDDKVHQSQLSKWRPLSVQSALLYTMLGCDPCLSLELPTVTHWNWWSRSCNSHWYISWIQFERYLEDEYSGVQNEQFY